MGENIKKYKTFSVLIKREEENPIKMEKIWQKPYLAN